MDTQGVGITQRLAPRVPENWSVAATCNLNWKCEAMSGEHPLSLDMPYILEGFSLCPPIPPQLPLACPSWHLLSKLH